MYEEKSARKGFWSMLFSRRVSAAALFTALFLVMLLTSLAPALAYYQSHNLSEIRNVDMNLNMGAYYVNTTSLGISTGTDVDNRLSLASTGGAPSTLYWGQYTVIHSGNEGSYDTDTNTQCDDAACSLLYLDGTGNNAIDTTAAAGAPSTTGLYWGNYLIWHAGNDGAGSGMAADTASALAADGSNCAANSFPLGVDASGNAQSCSTSISGNAGTATALSANGANCGAGQYAQGVDASGAAEGCAALLSGSGTATQVAYWTGASTLSSEANLVWDATDDEFRIGGADLGTQELQVTGNAYITDNTYLGDTGNYFDTSGNLILPQLDYIQFDTVATQISADATATENLKILAAGNIELNPGGDVTITNDNLLVLTGGITIGSATPVTNPGAGELIVEEDVWIGQELGTDDDSIYFDSASSESLRWDDSPGEFDLSDDLNIDGTLYADNVSSHSPLQLQTGGVTRVYINNTGACSNGCVGIGSTTFDSAAPEALKVYSNSGTSYNVISGYGDVNSYLQLNIKNLNSGASASSDIVATANDGTESNYYVNLGIDSSGYSNAAYNVTGPHDAYLYNVGEDLVVGTATAGKVLQFVTGGTTTNQERMRIDGSGYVGIGTTTPNTRLHVSRDEAATLNTHPSTVMLVEDGNSDAYLQIAAPGANVRAILFGETGVGGQTNDGQIGYDNTSGMRFYVDRKGADLIALQIQEDGTIVVNEDEINSGTSGDLYLDPDSDGAATVVIGNSASSAAGDDLLVPDGLVQICSSGTCPTASYATADGELYVEGQMEVLNQIHVNDSAWFDGNVYVGYDSGALDYLYFNEGTDYLRFSDTDGYFTINDDLYTSARFEQNTWVASGTDNVCFDGDGRSYLLGCTSLKKYKDNVTDLSLGLSDVLKLKPREFDWNIKPENPHDLGFVAEEVEEISPLLVSYLNGNLSGVKYDKMVSLLTNAIQEQQQEITQLKSLVCLDHPDADVCKA